MSDEHDDQGGDDWLDGIPDPAPDGGPAPASVPDDGIGEDLLRACAAHALNDVGNGQRFADYFGLDFLFVPRVGWHGWDGRAWLADPDEILARGKAHLVGPLIDREIPHVALEPWQADLLGKEDGLRKRLAALSSRTGDDGSPDAEAEAEGRAIEAKLTAIAGLKKLLTSRKAEHRRHARTSGNTGKIDGMLKESQVRLSCPLDGLDADPLAINTESGVLRFRVTGGGDTGYSRTADFDLVPHDRAFRLSKIMRVAYDPAAACPQFDKFLARVQPVPEMREFLLRWLGLSLTGIKIQKLAFFYGGGANGKSVLMDLVARMMGSYATTAKIESLTGQNRRGGSDATPDLVPLIGARMVRASEPEEGTRLQEGVIKELTGGEPMLVRALNKDFVEVRPHGKITISGNHKPDIRGTDDGIWRRVMLVPWDVQIPEHEQDPDLIDKLFAEAPGILNRLIEGLIAVLDGGLSPPEQVVAATQEYRQDSDPIGSYLQACCIVTGNPEDGIASRDLVDGFNFWLFRQSGARWQPGTIARQLKARAERYRCPSTGFSFHQRKASIMRYEGIRFVDAFAKALREAPRDHKGNLIMTVSGAAEGGGGGDGFE